MIRVSIPGKIHLIGEHSVVYGKTAILASINLYLHAKISKSPTKQVLGLIQFDDAISNMQKAIEKKIIEKFKLEKIPGYKIEIDKSGIPVGSGLGTSASLCAAFTICLLRFLDTNYSTQDVFEIALEGEKIFHGNPSGGDLATVLTEGLISFEKNKKDFKINSLNLKIPKSLNQMLLINSGKPEEKTSDMVLYVAKKSDSSTFKKIINSQDSLAGKMILALKKEDANLFMKTVSLAEINLEKLGVVSQSAKLIIRQIEGLKGAAKISGAGGIKKGSGMILAFHENPKILIEFAKKNNLDYYSISI